MFISELHLTKAVAEGDLLVRDYPCNWKDDPVFLRRVPCLDIDSA